MNEPRLEGEVLIIPHDVEPRYRWWEDPDDGAAAPLTIHEILEDVSAPDSMHVAYCTSCPRGGRWPR